MIKKIKVKKNNLKDFCNLKKKKIFLSYKNFNLLKKLVNSNFRILPYKQNNLKKFHQKRIKKYIKYSKYLGILPYLLKTDFN